MKDEIFIVGVVLASIILVAIASFELGKDAMMRESVVAGHALWAYDETGNPKFHWKEQETVIRQSK